MRPRIQGWKSGLLVFGAGCCAIAARAGDPPVSRARDSQYAASASDDKLHGAPARAKSTRTTNLLAPPNSTSTAQAPARSGVQLNPPIANESRPRGPSSSATHDARLKPIIESGFESSEPQSPQSTARGPNKPVAQFARQFPSQMQQRGDAPDMQRPPAQRPDSAEVPANVGQVDVQGLDQLGVIILRGNPQDVENMKRIIEEIQRISEAVEPYIRVFQLHRAAASQVRDTILELYSGSTGSSGGGGTQRTTTGGQSTQGGTTGSTTASIQLPSLKRFQVAADDRSNTLVISASPQMMEELSRLIDRLDADGAPIVNEVRVFQLKNAEAAEVTNILTQTISGQSAAESGATLTGTTAGSTAGTVAGGGEARIANRTAVIRVVPLDGDSKAIESGILDEVRVIAQVRTNSVIVSAPASSMPLMSSIIAELDKPPSIVASIKIFPLKNADATNMRLSLAEVFDLEPTTATGGAAGGGLGTTTNQFQRPLAVASGDHPPVSIRVAVDERTNSLIVSGPENALLSVEAIIRKLDLSDIYNRRTSVYRLKNTYAIDVASALQTFFTNKRTVEAQTAGQTTAQGTIVGAYQRFEQDVVVVALDNSLAATLTTAANVTQTATPNTQGVSNMLLISASPRSYDSVIQMIEELDAPQPQVMIQCIIAQLTLNDDFEFGIEFGLQNDVLFERGNLPFTSTVTTTNTTAGTTTATNATAGTLPGTPGFNFNSTGPLGNTNLARPGTVGNQGLSSFLLGRGSAIPGLEGVGGLILTASSKNITSLLRALHGTRCLEVISRPQIMTLDGRTARVQVGERFPYVGTVNVTETATIPTVNFENIGIILTVKPSITPDDRIYLEIVPEVSELLQLVDVQNIITQNDQVVIQAPRISTTSANTVVSVNDGQTVVLGGLIQKRSAHLQRKIPWLGDLPTIGFLFRYTQEREQRQELLIIMTPHIVRSEVETQRIKEQELSRLDWIIKDTSDIHGDLGVSTAESVTPPGDGHDGEPAVIRPMSGSEPQTNETSDPRISPSPAEPSESEPAPEASKLRRRIRRVLGRS